MVAVVHPFIEPISLEYKGPSIINWNPSSNLITTIQQIITEFNNEPPIPANLFKMDS